MLCRLCGGICRAASVCFIYFSALRCVAFVRLLLQARSAERGWLNILFDGLEPQRF